MGQKEAKDVLGYVGFPCYFYKKEKMYCFSLISLKSFLDGIQTV